MENTSSHPKLCLIQRHLIQGYILISPEAISRSSLVRRCCPNVACPFGRLALNFLTPTTLQFYTIILKHSVVNGKKADGVRSLQPSTLRATEVLKHEDR